MKKHCQTCMCNASAEPSWLLTLRYMARSIEPIFSGLVDGRWKEDHELVFMMEMGYIRMLEGGFCPTEMGLNILKDWKRR